MLYLDADLLALNKPSGLLVAPDRWNPARENLMSLLHASGEFRIIPPRDTRP